MRIEPLLLLGGQVAVGLDLGGVVDLVLAVRDTDLVAGRRRVAQRGEADLRAKAAGLDGRPLGLAARAVEVADLQRADLLAVAVNDVAAAPGLDVLQGGHGILLCWGGSLRRVTRLRPRHRRPACGVSL